MANLLEISELAYSQIFPIPRDKSAINIAEFITTAKHEYAAAMWIYRHEQISNDGMFQMPSDLLSEVELDVVNNEIDISKLNYLSALPNDLWLQNLGGLGCECTYIKTTLNLAQILCNDDSADDSAHKFYVIGKKIKFLKKPHKSKLPIIYANTGTDLNEREIEVNDYVASKVRIKLGQLYGKRNPSDETNNQSTNT